MYGLSTKRKAKLGRGLGGGSGAGKDDALSVFDRFNFIRLSRSRKVRCLVYNKLSCFSIRIGDYLASLTYIFLLEIICFPNLYISFAEINFRRLFYLLWYFPFLSIMNFNKWFAQKGN